MISTRTDRDGERPTDSEEVKTHKNNLRTLEAISRGVERKYDAMYGFSTLVCQGTVDVARRLCLPETEIREWVTSRITKEDEETKHLKTVLGETEHFD
jgi:hypothetical protein